MSKKLIKKFTFDGDQMSIYTLIEELHEALKPYGLSLKVDGEEHDGFDIAVLKADLDIAILKADKNDMFNRGQVIMLLHDYSMHVTGGVVAANASEIWLDKKRPNEKK